MRPTSAVLSKALRKPLTSKRGNKDFYKGSRQSALPGSNRTGAPGTHVVRGKAGYRLIDTKVRVFIAPEGFFVGDGEGLREGLGKLRPYVAPSMKYKPSMNPFGRFPDARGMTAEVLLGYQRARVDTGLLESEPELVEPAKDVEGAQTEGERTILPSITGIKSVDRLLGRFRR